MDRKGGGFQHSCKQYESMGDEKQVKYRWIAKYFTKQNGYPESYDHCSELFENKKDARRDADKNAESEVKREYCGNIMKLTVEAEDGSDEIVLKDITSGAKR